LFLRQLAIHGGQMLVRSGGLAALAELEGQSRFEAVVTDHRMPTMRGGELAAIVRGRWGLPVMLTTRCAMRDAGCASLAARITPPGKSNGV
jgi:CheY-like chemotaxis protein